MKNIASKKHTDPIDKREKVQRSNDEHIDQDFEGYPKNPSRENIINPKTKEDKLTAKTVKPNEAGITKNPAKKKSPKAGDPDDVEEALANNLGGSGKQKISDQPNKVNRIKKEKKK